MIAGVYMLVQLVVVGVVPHVAASKAPVADAFRVLLGSPGATLASFGAMISIFGYALGSVLQSPRVLYSMSERGELPGFFGRIHPTFRTPHVAILSYSGLALALGLYGSFEWNATLSAIVRLLTYGLTCIALLALRQRKAGEPGFRLPGAGMIAPAGALFCLWLLGTRTFTQAWILAAIVGVGALLYALAPRLTSAPRASE